MYSILARTEDGGKVEILVIPDALRKFWDETLAHAEDNQHK